MNIEYRRFTVHGMWVFVVTRRLIVWLQGHRSPENRMDRKHIVWAIKDIVTWCDTISEETSWLQLLEWQIEYGMRCNDCRQGTFLLTTSHLTIVTGSDF